MPSQYTRVGVIIRDGGLGFLEDYWNTYRNQLVLFGDDLDLKCIPESVWGGLALDSRYIESDLC